MDKKDKRMEEKIDNFHNTWGNIDVGLLRKHEMAKQVGVSRQTFDKYEKMFIENGIIKKEDIHTSTVGINYYKQELVDTFIKEIGKLKFKHSDKYEDMGQS
jgi:response regulator of citrate/malate metabolism